MGLPGRQQASVMFSSCCTAPANTRCGFLALLNISCMAVSMDKTAWHAGALLADDHTCAMQACKKGVCCCDRSAASVT